MYEGEHIRLYEGEHIRLYEGCVSHKCIDQFFYVISMLDLCWRLQIVVLNNAIMMILTQSTFLIILTQSTFLSIYTQNKTTAVN